MTDHPAARSGTAPTLADVAQLAKVSTATVSRCLNSPQQVVEVTRERVLNAVRELGYTPNFGARILAAKRTKTIGAIIPTMENAIFARGIQAFQEELREHGFTLLVASSSYQQSLEEEQIRTLTARGADALLLIGHCRSSEIYHFLEMRKVPALVAWVYQPEIPQASIGFDNRKAMGALAREVIRLGHKRISYISAETATNDRASERVEGVRSAMSDNGLNPEDLVVVETTYSIENGGNAFEQVISAAVKPTVVMCGNDVLAAGALQRAKKMGMVVPRDVSITGFDDIELATLTDPALATVHVPHRLMGRQAARLLIGMLDGNSAPASVELAAELCLRETLAAPK
jgi:LacI family transcriptional regulator